MAYSWTLATFGGTGSVTNPSFRVDGLAALASQFNLSVTGGAVILNYSPVPEPSCVLLLAAAGAGAVGLLRRRSGRRVNRALWGPASVPARGGPSAGGCWCSAPCQLH